MTAIEFIGGPYDGERLGIPTPLPPRWRFPRRSNPAKVSIDSLTAGKHRHLGYHIYRLQERFKEDVYVYEEAR